MARTAALAGTGLAYLLEDFAMDEIQHGRLKTVLDAWSPPFSGYYLYYPSRRQMSPALGLLVEALRYRGA
jgi:DNA-binding transcriptional LysR family regulator